MNMDIDQPSSISYDEYDNWCGSIYKLDPRNLPCVPRDNLREQDKYSIVNSGNGNIHLPRKQGESIKSVHINLIKYEEGLIMSLTNLGERDIRIIGDSTHTLKVRSIQPFLLQEGRYVGIKIGKGVFALGMCEDSFRVIPIPSKVYKIDQDNRFNQSRFNKVASYIASQIDEKF